MKITVLSLCSEEGFEYEEMYQSKEVRTNIDNNI